MMNEATASSVPHSSLIGRATAGHPAKALFRRLRSASLATATVALMVTQAIAATTASPTSPCDLSNFNVGLDRTGTGPFNTADTCTVGGTAHIAGNDACSTDNVVRTNDTFVYRFNYKIPAGKLENNITFTSTLPLVGGKKVSVWDGVPAQCSGPGSSVSADGLTLVCNIGNKDQSTGGDLTEGVLATVKATILGANNDLVNTTVSVATDACTAPSATNSPQAAPPVSISARQKVDFRKDVLLTQQSGYSFSSTSGGTAEPGYLVAWYVYMDQFDPSGASSKGGEAINSPVSFNDISTAFPPGAIWFDCFDADGSGQGTISCPARYTPASAGGPITITARPEELGEFLVAGGKNSRVERDPNTGAPQRLSTFGVRFWIPLAAINNPANQTPAGSGQIDLVNRIDGFNGTTISGQPLIDTNLTNNQLGNTVVAVTPGSYYKYVARQWPGTIWTPATLGLASPSASSQLDGTDNWGDSGTALVYPGQAFFPRLDYANNAATPTSSGSILCENFNNTQVALAIIPGSGGHAAGHYYSSPSQIPFGAPGNIGGSFPEGYKVEYGVANTGSGNPGPTSFCRDQDATWYPTVTAAEAAGQRDSINKVRMIVPQLADGGNTLFVIAQVARPGINGTYYPDYTPYQLATVNGGAWTNSNYNVTSNTGLSTGKRVQITTALARVQKGASINGNAVTTAVAGGSVTYSLAPSLQSILPNLPSTYVTIVDRLPAPLSYIAGSAVPAPDSIQVDAGGTTLTWTINGVIANTPIPTITFAALVPQTIAPNSSVVNRVVIEAPDDASPESQRQATKSITVLNPPGIKVFKSTSTPLIEPNTTATFKLEVANFENADAVIDVIDVIPHTADGVLATQGSLSIAGRIPPSAFAGTMGISSGSVTSLNGGVIRYKRGPVSAVLVDPLAVGNSATAADGWCLPAEFGTGTCPTNFAAAVAFRVTGMTIGGNQVGTINLNLPTAGNNVGNVYTNRFGIRTADTNFSYLRSNDVPVTVALGSISGKVYVDNDGGATQNNSGSNPEPSISGATVTLCKVAPVSGVCPTGQAFGSTTTGPTGAYSFANVPSAQYWIVETKPAGYANGPNNAAGSSGGAPGVNTFSAINLPIGANASNYNFGHQTTDLTTRVIVPTAPVVPGTAVNATVTFGNVSTVSGEDTTATITLTPGLPAASVTITPPAGWAILTPYNPATGVVVVGPIANAPFIGGANVAFGVSVVAPATGSVTITSAITNSVIDANPQASATDPNSKRNADQGVIKVLVQQIDVRKRAGTPRILDLNEKGALLLAANSEAFVIPYVITVANKQTIPATNVQVSDYLPATFPSLATIVRVQKVAPGTGLLGAADALGSSLGAGSNPVCQDTTAVFNGITNTNLLGGNFNLATGQFCNIEFAVVVSYPAGLVPAEARKNTAWASTFTDPVNPLATNPGPSFSLAGTPTFSANVPATDASTDSPAVPPSAPGSYPAFPGAGGSPSNGDVPDPTPVAFGAQAIDVRKSSSFPIQTDIAGKKFSIWYTVNVTNTGSVPATNVQLSENLKFTYPVPAIYTVTNVAPAAVTGSNACAASDLNANFDGGKSTVNGYNLLGSTGASTLTLDSGAKCVVTFKVDVDYSSGNVPTSPAQNRIFGSSASGPNNGPPFDPAGLKSGDNPLMINKDTSSDTSADTVPPVRPYGTSPVDPGPPPGGSKSDSGSGTPALLATLETVKATTGPAVTTSPGKYQIPYEVTVVARGSATAALPNVQAIDNLQQAFDRAGSGIPAISVAATSRTFAAIAGGACANINSTTGPNIQFFPGNSSLTVGQGCTYRFVVELDYGTNTVITGPHWNQVYASSLASGPNNGGTVSLVGGSTSTVVAGPNGGSFAGTFVPPAGTLVAFDASTNGNALPTSPAGDRPLPTPVVLPPPLKLNAIKYLRNASRPGAPAAPNDELEWTIVYKNDGGSPATNVQVTDSKDPAFTNFAVTSVAIMPSSLTLIQPNTSFNGTTDKNLLFAPTTLAPGEYLLIKIKGTVAATAVGTINNRASLSANELGGPTGTLLNTSAVNKDFPQCETTGACIPTGVTVPADSINSASPSPTGKGITNTVALTPAASVSGKVYLDTDLSATFTGPDTPIQGVQIVLCRVTTAPCPSTSVLGTTTTDPSGNYVFNNVPPDTYSIQEVQPQGYGSSTPNTVSITMAGAAITDRNFGETAASLTGRVYQDSNGSGTFNTGEPGIGGVTVKLCLSSDPTCATPVATQVTATGTGVYTFTNLPAPPVGQTYYIQETQSTVPPNLVNATTTVGTFTAPVSTTGLNAGTADSPGSRINGITWTPGVVPSTSTVATGVEFNFGELPQVSVSGVVFLDKDFGGTVTPGETGLPNNATTTLTLCRTNNSPCSPGDTVATTVTTPGSGTYTFPAVTPGSYFVVETQPTGYASSSPNTLPVTVAGTPITNVNFAETGASLSGLVYKDVDYSGAFNAGDLPLKDVTVRLCTTANCASGSVVATTVTSPGGTYTFANLPSPPAGQSYFIVEDQATVPPSPNPLSDGTTTVGSLTATGTGGSTTPGTAVQSPSTINGINWTPPTTVVAGVPAVVGTNYNFGEIEGVDIGGKVFFDKNRDSSINAGSDTGIPGVVMTLCRVATVPCPTGQVVGTTTTSVTGDYTFPRVPPGSYFVQETQPPGYGSSPASSDVRPITVASTPLTGINFADTLASIAGLVYRDDNGSQTRDGAETTMPPGITITLTGIDATGAPVTRTTVTDANGAYKFDDLKTGTYTITESQPAGFGTGASNVGTGAGGTGAPNNNAITNIVLPTNTDAVNYNFGDVPKTAGVSGTVWVDSNHDNKRDPGEQLLPGWTVEVYRTPFGGGTPTLVTSVPTDAGGAYSVTGLEAGGGYSIRFVAPGGAVFGGAVDGESGAPISGATISRGEITNLTLTASVTGGSNVIPQQSLPVDPSGVVYDSDTRLPVPGAQVTLVPVSCPTFNPATDLVGGAGNLTQTVGAGGFYQFLLNPSAPACEYRLQVTPPAGYVLDAATPPQPGAFTPPSRPGVAPIVPNPNAPQGTEPTTYYLAFNLNSNSRDVINNHIPLVAAVRPVIFITKVANKTTVEFGDTVRYTVKAKYVSGSVSLPVFNIVDSMPAGFKLTAGTSYVAVPSTAAPVLLPATSISGAPGAVVTYKIPLPAGGLAVGTEVQLTYIVRVAVGSLQGDATNRAQATSIGAVRSNVARATVKVNAGVFTSDGCVAGKVFVDCNNNHIQDAEELGIPGVRLYLSDGTYFVTDSEGKYSYCGLAPKSHVITVDPLTMPRGSRLTTTSNRNLGDGTSLFLDVKNGELMRADFAEGSCSNTVLEQVKARRTQGEVRSVDTEKTGQPAMKWEGKSPQYPQQGTDGANQPLVQPRPTTGGVLSTPEQNVPVPQMPGASSNTQGANVRTVK